MLRVLVVDDSGTMRRILVRCLSQLEQYEFEFDEAADGMDALEKLSKQSFDLILCDINMPRLDGIGLVRAVRRPAGEDSPAERATAGEVPILMVSTEGTCDRVDEAIMAGANGFLAKPFTPDELTERLAPFL